MYARQSYTEPLVPAQKTASKQSWSTLKIAFALIFCGCFAFASLHSKRWDTSVESEVAGSTMTIGIGTWNILDIKGCYSEHYGVNMEIQRLRDSGINKEDLNQQRKVRVINKMKDMVKQKNLEVLGVQELDAKFASDVISAMDESGYAVAPGSHIAENALFVKKAETHGGTLTFIKDCSGLFHFTDDKYGPKEGPPEDGPGAQINVYETGCGSVKQKVAFTVFHVGSQMGKRAEGTKVKEWAQGLLDTITGIKGLGQLPPKCAPDHIVVLADFNADLREHMTDFQDAGWVANTVPADAEYPFTSEHEYGKEMFLDGFLTKSLTGKGPIGWDGVIQNEMQGFMSKAWDRKYNKKKEPIPQISKYSYGTKDSGTKDGELYRTAKKGEEAKLVKGNHKDVPMSDHLFVYGKLKLTGCEETDHSDQST